LYQVSGFVIGRRSPFALGKEGEFPVQEEKTRYRTLKSGFLLLAALFAATNIAKFLHEIVHALGAWSTGGIVRGLVIHPFSWSYAIAVSPRDDIMLWAGSILGSLFGILITFSVFKWRSGCLLIPLLVGPVTCLCNGSYLVLGSVFGLAGDGSVLAARYAPAGVVAAVGLLMLCAGMLLAFLIIPELGFGAADGIAHRTAVLAVFCGGSRHRTAGFCRLVFLASAKTVRAPKPAACENQPACSAGPSGNRRFSAGCSVDSAGI